MENNSQLATSKNHLLMLRYIGTASLDKVLGADIDASGPMLMPLGLIIMLL